MAIHATFLTEGTAGQADRIAQQMATFIQAANQSLHIAIFDFRLADGPRHDAIIGALKARAAAGVEVQIAYDHSKAALAQTQLGGVAAGVAATGGDPAPQGTDAFLKAAFQGTSVQLGSISGLEVINGRQMVKLMHQKYIIRDGQALWAGSANFTDDSWSLQENNILELESPDLCRFYETDFQDLWQSGSIASTGRNDIGRAYVDQVAVDVAFSPGEGDRIDHLIAREISQARRRIKIASMLLASRAILTALQNALKQGQVQEFAGIYDRTQMQQTLQQWQAVPANHDLLTIFNEITQHLAGKNSAPYSPTSPHNFMHNKVVVCDDVVTTGSFNFSHSAAQNAENHLAIHDPNLADQYCAYIDSLIQNYH